MAGHVTPHRELQLVEAHRAGGPAGAEALAELIRLYQRRVYSICFRMLNHRDDAADVTQDALVKVIEGLHSYNGQSKLSTWVIRVTMNCCLSHLRRQKLRQHLPLEAMRGTRVEGPPGGPSRPLGSRHSPEPLPDQNVQLAHVRALVADGLRRLDPENRAILLLRDVQDLDYQQLAEVLEVPIGTVKSRLFRARTALRQVIERLEEHPPAGGSNL